MNLTLSKIGCFGSLLASRVSLAFWCALISGASNLAMARSQGAEWILVQTQAEKGEHTVYVSANAIKFVSKQWQYQLLAKAPDWKVHCFRCAEKVEWIGSLDRFDGVIMANPFSLPSKKTAELSKQQVEPILGLRCTKYLELPDKRTVMWAADDIAISPKAAEFICRYYFVPEISKVPIRRVKKVAPSTTTPAEKPTLPWMDFSVMKDYRSGTVVNLNTTSCKQVPFNASDFECPTGYQQVRQIERVAYSRKMKDDLEVLSDDIGFATHTGSKTTKSGAK